MCGIPFAPNSEIHHSSPGNLISSHIAGERKGNGPMPTADALDKKIFFCFNQMVDTLDWAAVVLQPAMA